MGLLHKMCGDLAQRHFFGASDFLNLSCIALLPVSLGLEGIVVQRTDLGVVGKSQENC